MSEELRKRYIELQDERLNKLGELAASDSRINQARILLKLTGLNRELKNIERQTGLGPVGLVIGRGAERIWSRVTDALRG